MYCYVTDGWFHNSLYLVTLTNKALTLTQHGWAEISHTASIIMKRGFTVACALRVIPETARCDTNALKTAEKKI